MRDGIGRVACRTLRLPDRGTAVDPGVRLFVGGGGGEDGGFGSGRADDVEADGEAVGREAAGDAGGS